MNNARLTCTREQKASKGKDATTLEVGSWPIEDICWYIGCETKRRPPYNLNITFIDRHKPVERSKERPHFGRTISIESREFFVKWIASMLVAEHSHDVTNRPSQTLLVIDWIMSLWDAPSWNLCYLSKWQTRSTTVKAGFGDSPLTKHY